MSSPLKKRWYIGVFDTNPPTPDTKQSYSSTKYGRFSTFEEARDYAFLLQRVKPPVKPGWVYGVSVLLGTVGMGEQTELEILK